MRIKEIITKGELRPVLKQFLPTSTVRNALGLIRRICMLILGSKGLSFLSFYTGILLYFKTTSPVEHATYVYTFTSVASQQFGQKNRMATSVYWHRLKHSAKYPSLHTSGKE